MSLKEYGQKRDKKTTTEPGIAGKQKPGGRFLVFVVHKHAARRLHYDLRLEMQGVLKSFAVPKGPSLDPSVKRLAVRVEDHPFAYKDFEGVIPEKNYGAGPVMIWDQGFYGPILRNEKHEDEKMLLKGLQKGDLKFVLAGNKLKGEFALVKTRWDEKSWLLLKKKDRYATTADVLKQNQSVVSGKTIEMISNGPEARDGAGSDRELIAAILAGAPNSPLPHPVAPMLAGTGEKPFNHADWLFEIKWDGYRAVAELDSTHVSLYSRNGLSFIEKYPPVVESLQKLGLQAVLDGEIIVADENGIPDFEKLQHYKKSTAGRLIYYVFDLLSYQGHDLTGLPLLQRKEILKGLVPRDEHIKYSEHVVKDGVAFFNAAKQKGIEGIVAKHSAGRYMTGARSREWLKIKNRITQDCVIAGFTAPRGSRKYLGSLVLGAYRKGTFVCIGHSGGAFRGENPRSMLEKLMPLVQKTCPFKTVPPGDAPATWVKPALVCEVAFTGWTGERLMRQPIFLRLRDDKTPREAVVDEKRSKD